MSKTETIIVTGDIAMDWNLARAPFQKRHLLLERGRYHQHHLATAHGCRFQAIDPRWGVSEEAALDQQTMKICLGEIERCQKVSPRPNFIVLLGDRYGWRPLPYEIPADEFEKIVPLVSDGFRREAVNLTLRRYT